ncbi:MFS transporter [Microtetraspora malaysiensis]|uniref:MFS transporter n=1 Tax=Microtetraspora malaysiensis TaxID=161358 RepID=A0ABW6SLQ6_9ACTN
MPLKRSIGLLGSHPDFRRLWVGESLSQIGSQVTMVAVPLLAVGYLNASTFEVAVLTGLETLGFVLIGLPAGVWCDRLRRRPLLISTDLMRTAAIGSIPLAAAFGLLTLVHVYIAVFVIGVCTVFFDVAYQSYLPSLVGRDHLVEGNAKLEVSRTVAQVTGPAVAGGLVQALTAPIALVVDALSFAWSAAWLMRIRAEEPAPIRHENAGLRRDLAEGVSFVWRHPILRAIALSGATSVLFATAQAAIFVVFLVRTVGLSAGTIGLLFSLSGIGAVAGALMATRMARWIGQARSLLVFTFVAALAGLLVPMTNPGAGLALFVVGSTASSFCIVVFNIIQVSFRQQLCPDHLLGRMNATMRFILWGTMPLASVLGGALATAAGLRGAVWITALAGLLGPLWLLFSPLRKMRDLPSGDEAAHLAGRPLASESETSSHR